MEHDEIYTLMMEALDGDLDETRQTTLDDHLHSCPSCAHEWAAVSAIHQLFLQAPVLRPAADFTQRTLAMLPSSTYRIWMVSAVYGLLLLSGILPLVFVGWLVLEFGPALNQPAFIRSLLGAGGQILALVRVVIGAGLQGLGDLGELLGQQPAILGLLLVMIGAIFLWSGVYSQLTRPQRVER